MISSFETDPVVSSIGPSKEDSLSAIDAPAAVPDVSDARRDVLTERLNQSLTDMMELCTVYLGERLGLYSALATNDSLTSSELAAATDTYERYAREWLEQQ